jgi:hypothetical protein
MRTGNGRAAADRAPRTWRPVERRLWNAARSGAWLELDPALPDADRTLRAAAVRTVLAAGLGPEGERRVRIRGALIAGRLELRGVTCGAALLLIDCAVPDGLNLTGSELPELALINCRTGPVGLGWLTTAGSVRVVSTRIDGPLYLTEARIGRRLDLGTSTVASCSGVGSTVGGDLDARRLTSTRGVDFTGARVEGRIRFGRAVLGDGVHALRLIGSTCAGDLELNHLHARGVVNLRTAGVGGRVVLVNARIEGTERNAPGPGVDPFVAPVALLADGLSTRGDLSAEYAQVSGEVRLTTAQIGGTLNLSAAQLDNPDGRALQADRCAIGSGLFALDGFRATGAVVLRDARVDGPVILAGGRIDAPHGRAFNASGLVTTGGMFAGRFGFAGHVRLSHAQIGGPLEFTDAELVAGADGDLALSAAGATVNGDIRATGLRATGTVDFSTVRVSGHVQLGGARLLDAAAPGSGSLVLAAMAATGSAQLDGVEVAGHVDLREAEIADHVRLTGAKLGGAGGRALRGTGLRAAQLRFRLAEPAGGRVGLAGAAVDVLADHDASWPTEAGPEHEDGRPYVLDGFVYQRIESAMPVQARLAWLARGTPAFEPQPYEQLAGCYRQMGREREARRVLRDKLRRQHAASGRFGRVWGWIQDLAVGYGYQPGRAVGWFLGLLVAGTLWFAQARCPRLGTDGVCPVKTDEHPAWDAALYTLDLLIPVVDIGHDRAWDPVGGDKVAAVALMAAGWVLVTTLVAAAGRALNRA